MIYTRLSYNTNNWHFPSGLKGKSITPGVHEFDYKFGFEEWLRSPSCFFLDKKGKEYQYGYLEGIHKNYLSFDENETLILFTINCTTHQRFLVGDIKKWQKVNQNESHYIALQNPLLINTMRNDIAIATNNFLNAIDKFNLHVNNQNGFQLFNIKYEKLNFNFDEDNLIAEHNPIHNLNRFWFYRR